MTKIATFYKIPSLFPREKLLYAHVLVLKVILEKQLLNVPIAERLKHFLNAWQILTGDLEVLAIVKDYHVPFLCQPHQKQILTKIKLWPKILRGGFIRDKTSWRSLY